MKKTQQIPIKYLVTQVRCFFLAARHVLEFSGEFPPPKLTPSLPRCVKAGVSFYGRNENIKDYGRRDLRSSR